jgi:hypothetical protein
MQLDLSTKPLPRIFYLASVSAKRADVQTCIKIMLPGITIPDTETADRTVGARRSHW